MNSMKFLTFCNATKTEFQLTYVLGEQDTRYFRDGSNPPVMKCFEAFHLGLSDISGFARFYHPSSNPDICEWVRDDRDRLIEVNLIEHSMSIEDTENPFKLNTKFDGLKLFSKPLLKMIKKKGINPDLIYAGNRILGSCYCGSNPESCILEESYRPNELCSETCSEENYLYRIIKPLEFEYDGPLWHRLKKYVNSSSIIAQKKDWVKTSIKDYNNALNRFMLNDGNLLKAYKSHWEEEVYLRNPDEIQSKLLEYQKKSHIQMNVFIEQEVFSINKK